MTAALQITVQTGPHKNKRVWLRGPSRCLIGRAPDCQVRLWGTERDKLVSRHHCQVHFDPESLTLGVHDFGSRNGTYLNGQKVESLETALRDDECENKSVSSCNVLTVGGTTLRLDVVEVPTETVEEMVGAWNEEEAPVA
jgi:eukaryotic-like serine/threonine-protein kinase